MATELQHDDIWFANQWNNEGFNLFSFLGHRYQTWSSRILIEFCLMCLCRFPLIVFWITDSVIMVIAVYLLYRLFAPTKHKVFSSVVLCLLFLCLPLSIYTFVGWIADTLNYLWPTTALLASIYAFKKISQNQIIQCYEIIIFVVSAIFATQSEQTAVVFLIVSLAFFIWSLIQKKIHWLTIVLLILAFLGIFLILLCPGNASRSIQETATWFPEYANFSLFEKIDLSFSVITWNYFKNLPIFSMLLTSIMVYLIVEKHSSWKYRLLALFTFSFTIFFHIILQHYDFMSVIAGNRYGIYSPGHYSPLRFLFYSILLLSFCILILNVYLILGHNIRSTIGIGIILLGFATQAMLGFSPTVWDSGTRTGFVLYFSVIALFVYLLQEWNFNSKTANRMLILPLATIAGYTILDELLTFAPLLQ